ncbi:MAG: hypothetical protein AAF546_00770 [Verrucomicrobiota bacterium]
MSLIPAIITPFAPQNPQITEGQIQSSFTLNNILRNFCIIAALVFVNRIGLVGNIFFFAVCSVLALRSSEGALKALSVVMLALITNLYFVEKSGMIWALGRFGILFLCAGRFFYDLSRSRHSLLSRYYFRFFLAFLVVCFFLSLFNNYFLPVSLLKLLAFGVGASAIFAGTEVSRRRNSEITAWFYGMILFVVLLGIVALLIGQGYNAKIIPGVYDPSDFYFNGPFYHSNTLGPIAAMMVVYLAAIFLFSPYRHRWLTVFMALVLAYFIYLTKSRTALGALAIGGFSMLALAIFAGGRRGAFVRFNLPKAQILLLSMAAVLALFLVNFFTSGALGTKVTNIVNKGDAGLGQSGIDINQVLASRILLYENAMKNFSARPLTGISFGTATDPFFIANATWYTAPTEKGNLFFGMLEEVGLIGSAFFWAFILSFLYYLIKDLNISGFGLFATFLMVNMGEMMFFSFGAHGALGWVMVGAGLALGDRCLTRQS